MKKIIIKFILFPDELAGPSMLSPEVVASPIAGTPIISAYLLVGGIVALLILIAQKTKRSLIVPQISSIFLQNPTTLSFLRKNCLKNDFESSELSLHHCQVDLSEVECLKPSAVDNPSFNELFFLLQTKQIKSMRTSPRNDPPKNAPKNIPIGNEAVCVVAAAVVVVVVRRVVGKRKEAPALQIETEKWVDRCLITMTTRTSLCIIAKNHMSIAHIRVTESG
ncbi:hypothetical protein GCK72_021892 [Caenorhabditis remanei]|uniref:Uncharacterized protein n=1 Tax=Caenorhabditis remanei TaxID=31234 RepID=A0A6A5GL00_CAERE|nr:hypothetical protein GCK72_021892 [Caenorhabditis remanei]KAF1755323.1 hypothetical protein GCK72_021892 [Caenorhabditis remanei]